VRGQRISAEGANRGLVGASFNVNANTGSATFTTKLQIIGAGGKADNVNVTFMSAPTAT
jgi:hypothetical protein